MNKVLIVKIGALGDLSFALPAAKALKDSGNYHISWVVGKSCYRFLEGHPYIDRLVVVDDKKLYSKNLFRRATEVVKLFLKLRQRFDTIIIMHRDRIYYQAFKPLCKGQIFQIVREKNPDLKHFIHIPPMTTHESLAIKKLIDIVVAKQTNWAWDYSYIPASQKQLPEKFIVLHLGGGSNAKTEFRLKCWPHWKELVLKLIEKTQLNLVFVGAPSEEIEYKNIQDALAKNHTRCLNLIGKTTLPELVDIIRSCHVFVGVDSGPLHIADSLDKKSIGLFGPTSTISWGLLSQKSKALYHQVPCSPCYKDTGIFPECDFQHQCMKQLDSERVFNEVEKLLN